MKKGISFQGFVPLRAEPDDGSEMISQVLFGEGFGIKEVHRDWLLIDQDHDGTVGWIHKDSVQIWETDTYAYPSATDLRFVSNSALSALDLDLGRQLILPAGSCWPSPSGSHLKLGNRNFEVLSETSLQKPYPELDLEEAGKGLISLPHIKGGRCGFGFDGPGLIQMLFRLRGLNLPRTCIAQAEMGRVVNFLHEVQAGDLAFFDNKEGEIRHVGLLLSGGRILHTDRQVRIDRFDQQGIFCPERDRYTHKLRVIKRMDV